MNAELEGLRPCSSALGGISRMSKGEGFLMLKSMPARWFKIRANLDMTLEIHQISEAIQVPVPEVLLSLYRLAGWFAEHGDYGVLRHPAETVDAFIRIEGFFAAVASVGWIRQTETGILLSGFCDVSTVRKSLGRKLREDVLKDALCAACGTADGLVVDHKIPVIRGGSSERENLQALCQSCNSRKGKKTMDEFLAE